jgi:hypothetical protein
MELLWADRRAENWVLLLVEMSVDLKVQTMAASLAAP